MIRVITAALGRRERKKPADPRLLNFIRGLTVGALIGAAIAGSSVWRRSLERRNSRQRDAEPSPRP